MEHPDHEPRNVPGPGAARRLTVLQVLPEMHTGGVERGTLDVARALTERGHRAIVISAPGRLVPELMAAGAEHVPWTIGAKSLWTLRFVVRLRNFLRDEQVDVLHARSRVPAWIAWLAWRGMPAHKRPRFMTTLHACHSVSAYSAIMTRGEIVIAVSETVRRYIEQSYPRTDLSRVRIIHRGIDPAAFPAGHQPSAAWRAEFERAFPDASRAKHLLTLPGRLGKRKGHGEFLQIVRGVRERGIDVHGLIVGDIGGRAERAARNLKKSISDAQLDEHITLTGHRSDIAEIHAVSDIVYCLSGGPGESFGRTVVEALTIGTPVIGWDIGGVHETLSELLPEGRVPAGDVRGAVDRSIDFLGNPPRPRPNTRFTLSAMLRATLALYEEIAAPMERAGTSFSDR